ncbi:MAG: ABC transporter permease [Candidatus Solibacter sp.]
MSLFRKLRHGIRVLTNRPAADRALDDEVEHYFDELAASYEAKGLSPAAAKREAGIQRGSALALRDEVRDAGWENWVSGMIDDCRYALRRMRRSPGFTCTAVLTLGLGIGATAAIFTVTDGVLLKPLSFPHAERLVALMHTAPGINLDSLKMSPSLYFTYREEGRVFEDVALWNGNRSTVTGLGDPEEAPTLFVTYQFLNVLGVRPAIGRGFTETDGDPQGGRTVVLSDSYWKRQFGGSPSVLGQRIVLDGNPHEIIGVLPAGFEFLDEKVSLVVPKRLRREEVILIQFSEDGIARLKPGVTLEQANADVARCLPLAALKFPLNRGFAARAFADARIAPRLRLLKDYQIGDIGKTLWILMAAVGILLLIACANVANLLLVRADGRQHELAVREALGAGWGRMARDLLAESVLLGAAGGLLGLGFCYCALRWGVSRGFPYLPRLSTITVDARTLAFTLVISLAAGLLFGLAPVWKQRRRRAANDLRSSGGRSMTQSRERFATQRALLAVQVALAMVLLVGSGLMLRTFQALRSVEPGFTRPAEVQIVRVSIPATQAAAPEQVIRLEEAILRKFSEIAGVSAVAITSAAPMEGGTSNPIYSADHDPGQGKLPTVRSMRSVSPGFVAVLGSRLVAGRDLTWQEMYTGPPVVMISANMARELWGEPRAALGKRIRGSLTQEWREVIGVLADLRDEGVVKSAPAIVYWPLLQRPPNGALSVPRNVEYMIRSPRAGSVRFVQELQQSLRSVNPNLPLANVRTLEAIYQKSMARTSFVLLLLAVAGAMALALGVVGIYGVIAYSVAQRRKEIGIRIALGSTQQSVTAMFLRQGMLLVGPGAVIGTVAALGATRLMQSLLFGVQPFDFVTYGAMLALLVVSALLASWLPARKAASADPSEALRAD